MGAKDDMTGPTHVAIALAGGLALHSAGMGPEGTGAWVALSVGSLAPDIDNGGAIARPGSLIKLLPGPIKWILNKVGLFISAVIRAIFGHRTVTHWPVWGFLLIFFGFSLGKLWLVWLGAGWLFHILGDLLTVSGVPLLGPVWTKDIKFSPLRTGSAGEFVIALALWGAIFYFSYDLLPPVVQGWVGNLVGYLKEVIL